MLEDDESAPAESSLRLREKISAFSFQNSEPTTPWRSPRKAKSRETPPLGRTPSTKLRSLTTKRGFAPPEKYSHLNALQDYLEENLDIVFCGINPGQNSAEIGHHFGGPTNHFWPCLYESGLTTERLQPTQDHTLPSRFSIGMTNLVDRPTAEQNELSRAEQLASVPSLLSKISKYKPKIVCFVGLGISQVVRAYILPKPSKQTKGDIVTGYGLQPFKICYDEGQNTETLFFALASTSGRVVKYQKTHKVEQFKELKILLDRIKVGEIDTTGLQTIQQSAVGS